MLDLAALNRQNLRLKTKSNDDCSTAAPLMLPWRELWWYWVMKAGASVLLFPSRTRTAHIDDHMVSFILLSPLPSSQTFRGLKVFPLNSQYQSTNFPDSLKTFHVQKGGWDTLTNFENITGSLKHKHPMGCYTPEGRKNLSIKSRAVFCSATNWLTNAALVT